MFYGLKQTGTQKKCIYSLLCDNAEKKKKRNFSTLFLIGKVNVYKVYCFLFSLREKKRYFHFLWLLKLNNCDILKINEKKKRRIY